MDFLVEARRRRIAAGCACARSATGRIGGIGCFLLLICSPLTLAGVNTLTQVSAPGGNVTEVVYDPSDSSIAFAATSAGVYRSIDKGVHWTVVFDPATNALTNFAVDPAEPGRLVVIGSAAGFYGSSDHGATFAPLTAQPQDSSTGRFVAFSSDGSMLYAASSQYLFRSSDGGKHWTQGAALPIDNANLRYLTAFAVDPTSPLHLYAAVADMGAESLDGGASWHAWTLPAHALVLSIAVAKSSPQRVWIAASQGVFYSEDNGVNWTSSEGFSQALLVAVDPNNPSVIYADLTAGGLSKSSDNGLSWTNLPEAKVASRITSIAIDPHDSASMLISSWEGIARSTDAGLHWTLSESGIEARAIYELKASKTSQRVYARTINGGLSAISSVDDSWTDLNTQRLRELSPFHIASVNTWYIEEGTPDVVLASIGAGITKSTDGGMTWGAITAFPGATNGPSKIVAGSAGHRVLVAETQDAMFRSEDAGDSWKALPNTLQYMFLGLASAPSNPTTVYSGARMGTTPVLLRSSDGGVNWDPVTSFPSQVVTSITIDTADDKRVYVCTVNGLFMSSDGGTSWIPLDPFAGGAALSIAVDPNNPAIVYASTFTLVARSIDGGSHWQRIVDTGTAFWVFESLAVSPSDPSTVYVGAMGRGVHQIRIAPDLRMSVSSVPQTVTLGTRASYSLVVTNAGPFHATGVRVTVALPDIVSGPIVTIEKGQCSKVIERSVTCTVPALEVDAKVSVGMSMDNPTEGKMVIEASVAGDQPDVIQTDNTTTIAAIVAKGTTTPTPSAPKSGGGGGGGGMQFTLLCMLAGMLLGRERCRPRSERCQVGVSGLSRPHTHDAARK
jgi:uncharacterized repeat protein (TIGR01451 family)